MLQFRNLAASEMETRYHSKNGASPKSHTNRNNLLRFSLLILFSIMGFPLLGQVSDIYKNNPYKRDSKEVSDLKNNIEITGKGCDGGSLSVCSEVYVKNKTNEKFCMLISGWWSRKGAGGTYSMVIFLNPNENKKLPSGDSKITINEVSPILKTENFKFNSSFTDNSLRSIPKGEQTFNGIEYGLYPAIVITEEDKELHRKVTHYKVYFNMLVIDDLGNKQVVSKSEIVKRDRLNKGWFSQNQDEYIKQYNYSKFYAKVTRIDIAETVELTIF